MSEKGDLVLSKISAIEDTLAGIIKNATELAQLTVALAPLREKISKLHMGKYAGKELSCEQISSMVGVQTTEKKVEENRLFWEHIKLAVVDALLKVEGFKPGTAGMFRVGE